MVDHPPARPLASLPRWHRPRAVTRLGASVVCGVVAAGGVLPVAGPWPAGLIGWDVAAVVYLVATWCAVWPHGAASTRALSTREDSSRAAMEALLLAAAVASLAAVGALLAGADGSPALIGLTVPSVALSWALVHTVFCLRYANVYYTAEPPGGLDVPGDEAPDYADFAYLAFTIGMTYQVSDTGFTSRPMRRLALRHALLSFLFGTVILASTVNLVAGLAG